MKDNEHYISGVPRYNMILEEGLRRRKYFALRGFLARFGFFQKNSEDKNTAWEKKYYPDAKEFLQWGNISDSY